jgi:hypothetical protein
MVTEITNDKTRNSPLPWCQFLLVLLSVLVFILHWSMEVQKLQVSLKKNFQSFDIATVSKHLIIFSGNY